jgi:hypothetical protein
MNAPNKSDLVRAFVNKTYIEPARKTGADQVVVRVGEVHSKMGLTSRLPLVCGAMGANIFCTTYRLTLLERNGPQNGSSLTFTFKVLP